MRHRKRGRKLNRNASHRKAMKRNLTRSLFESFGEKGYIVTTPQKAKECRPFAERLVTLAKEKTLHRYRLALSRLGDKRAVRKLFDEIGPAYRDRPGGYTRILRIGKRRLGDNAAQVVFGFVESQPAVAETPAVDE